MSSLAPHLQAFFADRLVKQQQVSPHTICAYRGTFRLLLGFLQQRLGKAPSTLLLQDLDSRIIIEFLEHLETHRHNHARTRNARLAAIRSFFRYLALREPAESGLIQQVLAIPEKRAPRVELTFLESEEIQSLLAAPNRRSWIGRRDHALLLLLVQTGLRVSESTRLKCQDVQLEAGAHVHCIGKGRKERCTPLTQETVAVLRAWLRELEAPPSAPLFPSRRRTSLSSDAVESLVDKYTFVAQGKCASLRTKHITPHVLRHTCAMRLLMAGVDCSVIALWLGHESYETTQIYLHADLSMKERAIARTAPLPGQPSRYSAPDTLLAFLEAL
jgi:site-specific recombinase XerD